MKDQILRLAGEVTDTEEDELDRGFAGIGEWIAGDQFAGRVPDAQLLLELAGERLFEALAGFDLPAGELPFEGMRLVGRALSDQDFAVLLENRRHYLNHVHIGAQKMWRRRILPAQLAPHQRDACQRQHQERAGLRRLLNFREESVGLAVDSGVEE